MKIRITKLPHLTTHELAKRWAMSPRTLANWRAAGKGPYYFKAGWTVFYTIPDVIHYETLHPELLHRL